MTTDNAENHAGVTVDDQNYPLADLPGDVQELVTIYQRWETALAEQRLEVFKSEAALRGLSTEIQSRVRAFAKHVVETPAKTPAMDQSIPGHETVAANEPDQP